MRITGQTTYHRETYGDVIYEGEWRDGEPNGHGVLTWSSGEGRYEGEFVNGKFEGQGIVDYPDGTHYEGGFRGGWYSGHGVCNYPSGIRYEGEYDDGNLVGQGTVYFADGTRFEGVFTYFDSSYPGRSIENINSGRGVFTDLEGNRHKAVWVMSENYVDCTGSCEKHRYEYFSDMSDEILTE